jgi:hypothetical protein
VKPKGAPGLAFETWDPSNQFPLETPTLLFVIRSEAEGSAVSLSLATEAEEENCRSLGFARDDKKERAGVRGRMMTNERVGRHYEVCCTLLA